MKLGFLEKITEKYIEKLKFRKSFFSLKVFLIYEGYWNIWDEILLQTLPRYDITFKDLWRKNSFEKLL